MIWLKRTTAILALTFGAGLLWMPFPGEISGESMREVVVLEVDKAPFSVEEARAQFSETILELSYENLDQTPEFREAVLGVYGRGGEQCFSTAEWDFLLSDWGLVSGEGSVFTFRDGLHRINRVEEVVDDSEGPYTCIEVKLLGTYDNREWEGMTHLDEAVLADYPEIDAEVRRLADGVIPAAGGEAIKVRKWRHFHRRELDDLEYRPRWVVFDRLFSGAVEDVEAPWTLNTPWLRGSA
ncbi:MAG: hypothetical protein GY906_21735, partial [bacterium]|nr:hypothetical protein [bacterium]